MPFVFLRILSHAMILLTKSFLSLSFFSLFMLFLYISAGNHYLLSIARSDHFYYSEARKVELDRRSMVEELL